MNPEDTRILVTGGSGFIAGHVIANLLARGHRVRTTARSGSRDTAIREHLSRIGVADPGDRLEIVAADLLYDDGWAAAAAGCHVVMHVASPVVPGHVQNEDDVIVPAREGTLRVLRAARDAGASRVVLTSAFHAIGFGWGRTAHVFTEEDWSDLEGPGMDAYGRSKVLAERAAWNFIASEGGGLQLTVLNPVAVLGPVVSDSSSGGNAIVKRILTGEMDRYPDVWIPIVDVRDVAEAHALAAMTPTASGERFILAGDGGMKLAEIAETIRSGLGQRASEVSSRRVPSLVVRVAAVFNPQLRGVVSDLGVVKQIEGSKARAVLGWEPRPTRETVVDAAASMLGTDPV